MPKVVITTLHTFYCERTNRLIGKGDAKWAEGIRKAWGDQAREVIQRVIIKPDDTSNRPNKPNRKRKRKR